MRYAIVIEQAEATSRPTRTIFPDTSQADVDAQMREAIAFHLDGPREDCLPTSFYICWGGHLLIR
jgi:hypothetical protein